MAPLPEEVIEKADALLRAREGASLLTATSDSIKGWLEKTIPDIPTSINEVYHPLSSSPNADTSGVMLLPQKAVTEELLVGNIKEEPVFPESGHSTPLSASFTDPQLTAESPSLGKQGKISSSPKRPQPIGASAPTAVPRKSKPIIRGLSILYFALEIPLEVKLLASGKKPKAISTPLNLVVWYNPRSCHIGRLPTGSIEMKELKSSPDSPIKGEKPSQ